LLLLALLVLAGWWSARKEPETVPAALWAGLGALAAFGLSDALAEIVGRVSPYRTIPKVEVLVARSHGYSFPSAHAAVAGAVVCGLLLARRRRLAALAVVAGALLVFGRVYVGAQYPGDVAGGVLLGVVVSLALWPLASWALNLVTTGVAGGPLRALVAAKDAHRAVRRSFRRRSHMAAPRLPDAKAMDALRAASQAARTAGQHAAAVPFAAAGPGLKLKTPGETAAPASVGQAVADAQRAGPGASERTAQDAPAKGRSARGARL
jgi:undecaprenyl-diphosphatase